MARLCSLALTIAWIVVASSPWQATDLATVWARNSQAVAHVTTEGTLFNGQTESTTGTAFAISAGGYVVTANHVVLGRVADYKRHEISLRFGSLATTSTKAEVVATDPANDLALLRADTVPAIVDLGRSSGARTGQTLSVMGFPLAYDLHIVGGVLSNRTDANRWHTDSALNPGNSGGPVFDGDGFVIGVVRGGAVSAQVPGRGAVAVEGIKFFTPIDTFHTNIGQVAKVVPKDAPTKAETKPQPSISRGYTLSEVKDDHPVVFGSHSKSYRVGFDAEPRYRIVEATLVPHSANFVSDARATVIKDGAQVLAEFTLTSGPMVDRFRGWLDATVLTRQILVERSP